MRIYRQTGRPIKNFDAFQDERKEAFTSIENVIGKFGHNDNQDKFQELLLLEDNRLAIKYPLKDEIDLPKDEKELAILCDKYGALCFCVEDGVLTAYIMDVMEDPDNR